MTMTEIRIHNLTALVKAAGGTAAFAARYDVDQSYVSQIIKKHCAFGERAARNMERKTNLPEGYLDRNDNPAPRVVDQYNVIAAMGNGILLRDQAGIINEWVVSDEWLRQNIKGASSPKNLKIVTGFGDSMLGMFNSGDPLIVDIGVRSVDFDGVYFFRVGSEGFIKRLQRIPGVGLRAISENKAYEAWNITDGMDFEVFGRVLKVWQGVNY